MRQPHSAYSLISNYKLILSCAHYEGGGYGASIGITPQKLIKFFNGSESRHYFSYKAFFNRTDNSITNPCKSILCLFLSSFKLNHWRVKEKHIKMRTKIMKNHRNLDSSTYVAWSLSYTKFEIHTDGIGLDRLP